MGFFDFTTDRERKRQHERAFGKGVKDFQNADWADKVFHGFGDGLNDVFGKGSKHHQSYEAGYHSGKKRRRSTISVTGSSESGAYGTFCLVLVVGLVILLIVGAVQIELRRRSSFNPANGRMTHITANEPNLRAGPGTKYQIIRTLTKGDKVISFKDEQKADGHVWIRAATPDGQAQGWIVRKYVSK